MVRHGNVNLFMVLFLLLAAALGGTLTSSSSAPGMSTIAQASPRASPVPNDSILYEAVSPTHRDEVVAAADGQLSQYTISATLHPPGTPLAGAEATPTATSHVDAVATPVSIVEAPAPLQLATISGTQEVNFVNNTGGPLTDLYVRLSPNLRQYGDGRMVVDTVTVDGVAVVPEPPPLHSVPNATPITTSDPGRGDLSLLRLPLTNVLPSGGTGTIHMAFTTTVPMATPDEPGVFSFAPEAGTWTLAAWFPILAGYDPSTGWDVEPPAAWGDVTFANTALFDVTLTAPDDLVLVTTGVEVEGRTAGEHQVRRFTSGPVRDFALVAGTDFESVSTNVNGTTVTSYYTPEYAVGGAQILEWAAQSLAIFTDLFGPYPYAELDLVPVTGVIGMEFPQLLMIGAEFYPDPVALASRPGAIEFVVAHEVSHQWWYGLVGNNQHHHAFLDEGLAEYSAVLYFERQYGADVAEAHLNAGLRQKYATLLLTDQDWVVDQPTAAFPDLDTYFTTVYRKGGLGFATLRSEIGDEAFFAGLRDYAATMRFAVALPHDLQGAFERAAERSVDDLWHLWFETARGRVEIIMETGAGTPAAATPVASPIASPIPDG